MIYVGLLQEIDVKKKKELLANEKTYLIHLNKNMKEYLIIRH